MSDAIGDILNKRSAEPPEIRVIKDFVQDEIGIQPKVTVTKTTYIVYVPGASAAATLRFRIFQLQRSLGNERKIVIRFT